MKKPALFLPGAEGEPEDPASANWRGEPEANAQRARRARNGKTKRDERKRNQNASNANTRTNLTKTADQNEPNLAWKRTSEQISAG